MEQVRVLIADDQLSTRRGLRALLSLCPQVEIVGEATNGLEALNMVAKRQPDVVLMDMQMPAMDGLVATKRIKEQWPAVRVIALTLYPGYRVEAMEVGVDAFLLKGSATDLLQDTILAQKPDLSGHTSEA